MEKIKVLFVDDDIALGKIVTLALNAEGYAVEFCTSLAGISTVVREMQPDIVVLDVEIGMKNGIDAATELSAQMPDTPVLFVSSHVSGTEVARALDAGGMAYLHKPFEMEELTAYIRRYTGVRHPKDMEIGRLFCLRTEDNMLMKTGQPVRRLSPLEAKLLKLLVQYAGKLVGREQIMQALWENDCYSEQGLNNYIAKLRKYLMEDEHITLENVPKKGYRIIIG